MTKTTLFTLLFFSALTVYGQTPQSLEFNKEYKDVALTKQKSLSYKLALTKDGIFQISVLQQGIAIAYELLDKDNHSILKSPIPEDIEGYLKREYVSTTSGLFYLNIKAYDDPQNTEAGKVTIFVKSLNKNEIAERNKIRKALEPENRKNVQTLDLDHFWEAFDNLKKCKNFSDSVTTFQKIYLDRATNGLIDFIRARDFTAEKFVQTVSRYPKFYNSIRKNTFEAKKAEPAIENIFKKFKEIYPNFKPFKVCFAIGIVNTGGTTSENFVLIGTEITTSNKDADLSEFLKYGEQAKAQSLSGTENIIQKIKNMVAHECVHTQQRQSTDTSALHCMLLYKVMREGFCDFIGELVSGSQINNVAHEYGDKNEKQIWADLKNELCNENIGNWLYNASTVKDKPADLGYYVGYKIAQEYYKNSVDKKQAIVDIIEVTNPKVFLDLSKYDQKAKK
jgi:Predicted Zn-dependent protease (DUF2268)